MVRKSLFLLNVLLALSGFLAGCGGAQNSTTAPSISDLQYYPPSAMQNDGGGRVTVNAVIDFQDPNGDIATLTVNGLNGTTITLSNMAGLTAGSLFFSFFADTTMAGNYTLEVFVTDKDGQTSNRLTGEFDVIGS